MTTSTEDLRYPIGKFHMPDAVDAGEIPAMLDDMEALPDAFRKLVEGFDEDRLETPYRPGGWTVRQVIHHVPDSHLNSYVRFKLAITEDRPTIKPYDQSTWAETAETRLVDPKVSLDLLDALHRRWVPLLRNFGEREWAREIVHPEAGPMRLDVMLTLYAWHGRHHLAQVESLARREGWI